jgi:hypothetical protein
MLDTVVMLRNYQTAKAITTINASEINPRLTPFCIKEKLN